MVIETAVDTEHSTRRQLMKVGLGVESVHNVTSVKNMDALNTKMLQTPIPSRPEGALAYPAVVGQVLARLREERGLKQGDMATRVGLSQSAYSRLEKGDSVMNLAQLHKVCVELGVAPSEVTKRADFYEMQLKAQGVQVLHEKPESPAALMVGLGLLAAMLLSNGR